MATKTKTGTTKTTTWRRSTLHGGQGHSREAKDTHEKLEKERTKRGGWLLPMESPGMLNPRNIRIYLNIHWNISARGLHINTTGPSPSSAQPSSSLGFTSTHVSLPGATSRFDTLREGKSLGPPNTTSAA